MHGVDERNLIILERMSRFLNAHPRLITGQDVDEVAACGVSREDAVLMLMGEALGLSDDRTMMERYVRPSLARLDPAAVRENPYVREIRFPEKKLGSWQLTQMRYAPYEMFVRDDLLILPDGREIPRLGYFEDTVVYPAVLENGREWMTVTPNEMATMQAAIDHAHGHAAAMGLGLGYFAFMASRKADVERVTVVERDADVIALFETHILPQMKYGKKIRIVQADAFDYAQNQLAALKPDTVFVDLWHDVSDGAPMYLRMKAIEARLGMRFEYWIETSIASFLKGIMA